MSWLPAAAGGRTPVEQVLGWNPALLDKFAAFHATLWEDGLLEPELLELLRLRIAHVHGCESELAIAHDGAELSDARRAAVADWRGSSLFSDKERDLLAYAEMIPFQHAFIDTDTAAPVKRHLDDRAFVAFTLAVTLFDALCRLRMAFDMAPAAGSVPAPTAAAPLY